MIIKDEYYVKINRVIDYINENIDSDFKLDDLSKIGCMSKFHFHRTFKNITGNTLNKYINRIRLEKSINFIYYAPCVSITDVAMRLGYSTASNFTKAFKNYYGFKPSNIKKIKYIFENNLFNKFCSKCNDPKILKNEIDNNIVIKKLPSFNVVYTRMLRGFSNNNILNEFKKNKKKLYAAGINTDESKYLGIVYNNPEVTKKSNWQYDICISIPDKIDYIEGFNIKKIDEGKYAVYKFYGNHKEINRRLLDIYKYWLPDSKYEPDDRGIIEIFNNEPKDLNDKLYIDFCIPIK